MLPRLPHCFSATLAYAFFCPWRRKAQVIPFAGNFGQGLAPSDNQTTRWSSTARRG